MTLDEKIGVSNMMNIRQHLAEKEKEIEDLQQERLERLGGSAAAGKALENEKD